MNFLSFCLSGKIFTSPSRLKNSLAGYSVLGWRFYQQHFKYTTIFFLGLQSSDVKLADRYIGNTYILFPSFDVSFGICSLSLNFGNLLYALR
jgi:hypothetical protein